MCIGGGEGQGPSQEHKLGSRHDVFFWIVGLVDRDRSLLMSKISPRTRRVTIS